MAPPAADTICRRRDRRIRPKGKACFYWRADPPVQRGTGQRPVPRGAIGWERVAAVSVRRSWVRTGWNYEGTTRLVSDDSFFRRTGHIGAVAGGHRQATCGRRGKKAPAREGQARENLVGSLSVFAEVGQTKAFGRLRLAFLSRGDEYQHEDRDQVRQHLEDLEVRHAEARNIVVGDE